jgi:predicted ribosomally synthesized peptide with SipW-like signal peptide
MKRILMSFMTIAAVAAVAGVGSFALWSDSESSENNYIAAGSLDLLVDESNWNGSAKVMVDNAYPGATGSAQGTVTNNGTIDGNLTFSITSVTDYENDLIEPEQEDGDTTSGTTEGELCDEITVEITYDGNSVYTGPLTGLNENLGLLAAGETNNYAVSYTVDSNANNTIMTDECEFDMELVLAQIP